MPYGYNGKILRVDLTNKKIDVEEPDRVALEFLFRCLVAVHVRQSGDAVPLQAAVQRGPRQMRNGWLKRIEAIVQWQERVAAESHNDRFVLDGQNRRTWLFRSGPQVGRRSPALPLGDGLRVDAISLRKRSQALLTILYCSTHRLCRRGAPVQNLSHSASFHSWENNLPSNAGTKHLEAVKKQA